VQAPEHLEGFKPVDLAKKMSLSREPESWSNKDGRARRQRSQLAADRFDSVVWLHCACRYVHQMRRMECGEQLLHSDLKSEPRTSE
jgi:hypothetical protein